jgi:polysaccharide export outer membrane protein
MVMVLFCLVAINGFAQTNAPANAPTNTAVVTPRTTMEEDTLYRIGPGDVIEIRVFGKPEMSKEARVDNLGRIRPVFIQEEISVACMTETQIARLLEEKYRKWLRSPQIDVFVKDYKSVPVAVIGAVTQPGRFQLQRRIRLYELLSQAGGASGNSGTKINIYRSREYNFCSQKAVAAQPPASAVETTASAKPAEEAQLITLNLRDVMMGTAETNIFIEPGDIVNVPDADQIFLVGGVMKPGAIPMRQTMRLSEAIGMAGGFFTDVNKKKITISRQIAGSTAREIRTVNYDDIEKKKAEDLILQASDLIDIPASAAKGVGRSLLGMIAPTAAQMPLRIVRPY